MLKNRTLLIIGAGASQEAGLPVGIELAKRISQLLTYKFDLSGLEAGNEEFLNWLKRLVRNRSSINDHLAAAARIAKGVRLVGSIDNYVDTHQDDACVATCGKAAIAYLIAKAEQSSNLHGSTDTNGRETLRFDPLEKTWFTHFGRLLVDQVRVTDLGNVFQNLAIICFNYDRCIEQFLAHWLSRIYALDLDRARTLVETLQILRPYGQIADLRSPNRHMGLAFGDEVWRQPLELFNSRIKTYTEQVKDNGLIADIHRSVEEAETIVFLGFAFHPHNMRLITPENRVRAKRVFASAYGFSDADVEDITTSLNRFLAGTSPATRRPPNAQIYVRNNLTCAGIFTEFRRSLSSALPSQNPPEKGRLSARD